MAHSSFQRLNRQTVLEEALADTLIVPFRRRRWILAQFCHHLGHNGEFLPGSVLNRDRLFLVKARKTFVGI